MTRDEILGNSYSAKGLIKAANEGFLFDYIAQWYTQISNYELKEVLLAVLGVGYDLCGIGSNSYIKESKYNHLILEELANREFGEGE